MTGALDLGGLRILIVDDDPVVRRVLGRTLREWGAEVVTVENGARGIVELKSAREQEKRFDVVFLDTTLSGLNGFEVTERVRETHPDEPGRFILLVAENTATREATRARTLGAGGCLEKPLTRPTLVRAIEAIVGPRPRRDTGASSVGHFRVLLAEDSADTRYVMGHYLPSPPFEVDAAENGKIALDLFRLADYDAVIMDIQMPVYDGYWAIEHIRSWEKQHQLKRTPILAVTAYALTEDAQKCLRAGFDGYLTKPLLRETLIKTVERFVGATTRR